VADGCDTSGAVHAPPPAGTLSRGVAYVSPGGDSPIPSSDRVTERQHPGSVVLQAQAWPGSRIGGKDPPRRRISGDPAAQRHETSNVMVSAHESSCDHALAGPARAALRWIGYEPRV